MSVNKVILIGHVGRDPEIKHLDKDVAVANFPFATSENYTAKTGERVSTTEWHNIVAWRNLAELTEKYIKKGRELYIEGRIRTRNWDDKDGVKHYITEIFAQDIKFVGKRDSQTGNGGQPAPQEQPPSGNEPDFSQPEEDDLPF